MTTAPVLLTTKLFMPTVRTDLVVRPRLRQFFDRAHGTPVILVSAPAGFGKTTAVVDWLHEQNAASAGEMRGCWLALDEQDNDPIRFLNYLIAALERVAPTLGGAVQLALRAPQPAPIEALLTMLINDLSAVASQTILVLDDYHTITTPAIHSAVSFLVDHLPPTLRLVIISRTDPPFPLSRWRVRRLLVELRANDLRFALDEAAEFLDDALGVHLSPTDVAALDQRTEGWIAGLQLAALSMQGRSDLSAFIQHFTGSNTYIIDYLAEEVLQRQPSIVQEFLLQTAILERLCGGLCDAVTGGNEGQQILEQVQRANLFLIPLDSERRWYRYHHLFAAALRVRLQQSGRYQSHELHRRARAWYAQHNLPADAINHALVANDIDAAARLIEQLVDPLLKRGEHATVHGWLDRLPDGVLRNHPGLALVRAANLVLADKAEAADDYLQAAEQALHQEPDPNLLGQLYSLRSRNAQRRNELQQSLHYAHQALALLSPENHYARARTTLFLGNAYVYTDQVAGAIRAFAEAARLAQLAGDIHTTLHAMCNQGIMLGAQGQLQEAMRIFRRGLTLATEQQADHLYMANALRFNVGLLLFEWNQLTAAKAAIQAAIDSYRRSLEFHSVMLFQCYLALLFHVEGDAAGAEQTLEEGLNIGRTQQLPRLRMMDAQAFRVRLWIMQGNLAAIAQWLTQCGMHIEDEVSTAQERAYVGFALALIATDAAEQAGRLLSRLLTMATVAGRRRSQIELGVLQALALHGQGKQAAVHQQLITTLTTAEPEGYVRVFVNEGAAMHTLLTESKSRLLMTTQSASNSHTLLPSERLLAYIDKLLAAFPASDPNNANAIIPQPTATSAASSTPTQALIEPLSERELEILRLVAAGLSNSQIADKLIITVGTVKRHLNNIFGKLQVSSRTQAIAQARALDLL